MSSETPTLVPCPVCGGTFKTLAEKKPGNAPQRKSNEWQWVYCPWCTKGAMTPEQVDKWKRFRDNPPIPRE